MSGDQFKKVSPGDPLAIPARVYNSMIDVISSRESILRGVPGASGAGNNTVIPVRNDTGAALSQFEIVQLGDPVHDPADADKVGEFKVARCMIGETPAFSTDGKPFYAYGVMQEPAPAGEIGDCLVSGLTICKVEVEKDWHKFAIPVDGSVANLKSAPYGDALIQWSSGTAGGAADWALVEIKTGIPPVGWGKATADWAEDGSDYPFVDVNPCENREGDNVDTGTTIRVYMPRGDRVEDPDVFEDAVIPYVIDRPWEDPPEGHCIYPYLDVRIPVQLSSGTSTVSWLEAEDKGAGVMGLKSGGRTGSAKDVGGQRVPDPSANTIYAFVRYERKPDGSVVYYLEAWQASFAAVQDGDVPGYVSEVINVDDGSATEDSRSWLAWSRDGTTTPQQWAVRHIGPGPAYEAINALYDIVIDAKGHVVKGVYAGY